MISPISAGLAGRLELVEQRGDDLVVGEDEVDPVGHGSGLLVHEVQGGVLGSSLPVAVRAHRLEERGGEGLVRPLARSRRRARRRRCRRRRAARCRRPTPRWACGGGTPPAGGRSPPGSSASPAPAATTTASASAGLAVWKDRSTSTWSAFRSRRRCGPCGWPRRGRRRPRPRWRRAAPRARRGRRRRRPGSARPGRRAARRPR